MKIEHHLKKIERFQKTINKLNYQDDYETLIEDFLLAAAHFINAGMHSLGTLGQEKDVKHNQLAGFLKREKALGRESEKVAELVQQLEQLRPSHVYGKGENGETAKKAGELFEEIRMACQKILKNES